MTNSKFSFIDLFAGIGGFRLALQNIGGKCIGFSEIAKDAINAYCTNFNESEKSNFGDITKIKRLPKHDFLTAGVPCQSWSIAGKKLGFDDDRGQLWNDTLFLLNECKPKVFIFENVKGLADPRNANALNYIMERIQDAGYLAKKFVLNAQDYGVPQTRIRIYIIGFRDEKFFSRFCIDEPYSENVQLGDVLDDIHCDVVKDTSNNISRWSLSCNAKGLNDYFLFNDLRNGHTTIHSWDIKHTTEKQRKICMLLLSNRRKSQYGILDGNALCIKHFQELDPNITIPDLEELVTLGILKRYNYKYEILGTTVDLAHTLSHTEQFILSHAEGKLLLVDKLKTNKELRKRRIGVVETLMSLEEKGIVRCSEVRYDFKNGKISTGLNGINRIFLPTSKIYPTLVASDTNDYVSTETIDADTPQEWKSKFLEKIYFPKKFRKITKSEACRIQGFPPDYILPESRARWMHLIGNSVAVPVIQMLAKSIIETGVFAESDFKDKSHKKGGNIYQPSLFDE